jgi:hypothetical protein
LPGCQPVSYIAACQWCSRLRGSAGKCGGDFEAARALGIAYRIDDGYLAGHEKDDIYPAGSSVKKFSALPVPAVYVIDKSGKIVFNYVNADFTVRLKAEDLLSAAEQVAGN